MVVETPINSLATYLGNNIAGNWNANTWNVLPAVLTTWSNLLAGQGNKTAYELYKEQAREYVNTAKMNAEDIKRQGEIALRNVRYANKLEQGNDVLRIAAGNGHLSGSNLDVLVRKEKIRKMNETTIRANYANQAMKELVNGYRQAGNTYLTLAGKAKADKYTALASILKGVETYVGLSVRDAKVEDAANKGFAANAIYAKQLRADQDYRYGIEAAEEFNSGITRGGSIMEAIIRETTPASLSLSNTVQQQNGTFESFAD